MFDDELAAVWDLMYENGRGKDYEGEARFVGDLVGERCPGAGSVLDVGCGTGSHLGELVKLFDHVEALDASAAMVQRARSKAPGRDVHVMDMREMALGRRYDAVLSLYTVVGYLPSWEALRDAIARMADHVAPGGVLVVEPWWFAENFLDGYVASDIVETEDEVLVRMSHTRERDGRADMTIHYLLAGDRGVRHFSENHSFGLWSRADYESAFAAAGCTVEFVPEVLYCGLFVARR